MNPSDAENLLKAQYNVPPVNKTDSPTPLRLKQWLGKTMSNVHCSLRKCIFRAWAEATENDGSQEPAQSFLHGRNYMKGPVGRCGIVAAFLATITHCSVDPEEFTFPDGPDGEALLRSFLATLAFVFSKIRMPLEADCLKPTAGGKRVSEATLHGGVLVAGRVVWASELSYLHVEVATEQLSKFFETNHEDIDRATISNAPPEVTQSKLILGANVDALTEDEPITPEELIKLRDEISKVPVLMLVTTVQRVAVLMPVTTVWRVAVLVLAPTMCKRELVLTSAATVLRLVLGLVLMSTVMRLASALLLAPNVCMRVLVLMSAATVDAAAAGVAAAQGAATAAADAVTPATAAVADAGGTAADAAGTGAAAAKEAASTAVDAGLGAARTARYGANARSLTAVLDAAGCTPLVPPGGAFYVYAGVGRLLKASGEPDSGALCGRLLADTGVAVTPGDDFDADRGGGYVRLSVCGSREDVDDAAARIAKWAAQVDGTVLRLVPPRAPQRRAAGSKTSVGRSGVVRPAAAGVEVPPAVTGASARGHRATASDVPSRVEGLSAAASARGHQATASDVLSRVEGLSAAASARRSRAAAPAHCPPAAILGRSGVEGTAAAASARRNRAVSVGRLGVEGPPAVAAPAHRNRAAAAASHPPAASVRRLLATSVSW
ncbi:hypothetical protein I4F81_004664 [Pyropia yezoensis]|uniref:Uncharacterized protein n=1 Tax=Pyropia yezoensis TaxID=2788 RepID=A0ACC3BW16_PYRYE|nr:hypothetical protein I4F81_004664 [Neopyropia yezoensis]